MNDTNLYKYYLLLDSMKKSKVLVKCPKCNYRFHTKSKLQKISCSSCGSKFWKYRNMYDEKNKKINEELAKILIRTSNDDNQKKEKKNRIAETP